MSTSRLSVRMAAAAALLMAAQQSAVAQAFDDRWSVIPKAHAEPAPQTSTEPGPSGVPILGWGPEILQTYNRYSPIETIRGRASFYSYHGGRTADGEPFNRNALTAAHRTLPFGTRLRVTDLRSGKTVDVVVTDRGPKKRDRIMDLSLGAAKVLGMTQRGVIDVRGEVLPELSGS